MTRTTVQHARVARRQSTLSEHASLRLWLRLLACANIVEGTVPAGRPEPGLFQQSLGWVDKDGNGIRYQMIYSNSYHGMGVYPVPTIAGGGRGGGAGGATPAGGGNGRAQ